MFFVHPWNRLKSIYGTENAGQFMYLCIQIYEHQNEQGWNNLASEWESCFILYLQQLWFVSFQTVTQPISLPINTYKIKIYVSKSLKKKFERQSQTSNVKKQTPNSHVKLTYNISFFVDVCKSA